MKYSVSYLLIIGVLIFAVILSVWFFYSNSPPVLYDEGFEEGLGGWAKDADLPLDPNNPGYKVAWDISRATLIVASGQYSLELYVDGRQDDGTIWIEREILAESNSSVHVSVSFDFHSEQGSFNTIAGVCAYAGVVNPKFEEDFTVLGPANEVAGWKRYSHEVTLSTGANGEVWVAVGITVRWETEMTYHIDDVIIAID